MIQGKWIFNPKDNNYIPTTEELFSIFPTIVEPKSMTVYCRRCHRWEYIVKFADNKLLSQCGQIYGAPFTVENSLIHYAYIVNKDNQGYQFRIKSQLAKLNDHCIFENNYSLDTQRKVLYKNGRATYETEDFNIPLCKEITQECLDDMGEQYRKEFGIKPTVASQLKGFKLLLGYTLSPFNINFFTISHHWGLNPYDKGFIYLSSGNTPTAESEMFDSLGIKPTKKIRRMYQSVPQSVICYAAAHDMGFNDVNILQKTYSKDFYSFLSYYLISFVGGEASYAIRNGLKTFVADMLHLADEKTVWNSIEKTVSFYMKSISNDIYITDGLNLYEGIHDQLSDHDKKDIMHEGFNRYTHDYLNRRAEDFNTASSKTKKKEEVVVFDIEPEFLDLEYKCGNDLLAVWNPVTKEMDYQEVSDYNRYCFYVARDSEMLVEIGSKMHNCVGYGYKNAVAERRATIVYAMFQGKMRICIEVSPDFTIRQSLGPCNSFLNGSDLDAYKEWCEKKKIQFRKAFDCHLAPRAT